LAALEDEDAKAIVAKLPEEPKDEKKGETVHAVQAKTSHKKAWGITGIVGGLAAILGAIAIGVLTGGALLARHSVAQMPFSELRCFSCSQ
jgi:hypothetical protein